MRIQIRNASLIGFWKGGIRWTLKSTEDETSVFHNRADIWWQGSDGAKWRLIGPKSYFTVSRDEIDPPRKSWILSRNEVLMARGTRVVDVKGIISTRMFDRRIADTLWVSQSPSLPPELICKPNRPIFRSKVKYILPAQEKVIACGSIGCSSSTLSYEGEDKWSHIKHLLLAAHLCFTTVSVLDSGMT